MHQSRIVLTIEGTCSGMSGWIVWPSTIAGQTGWHPPSISKHSSTTLYHSATQATLPNGDSCTKGCWIAFRQNSDWPQVAKVIDVIQAQNSAAARNGCADFIVVQMTEPQGVHKFYGMPLFEIIPTRLLAIPFTVRYLRVILG